MLVYSHPGEGKTVFWSTGGERVLFINSDPEGTISGNAQGNVFHKVDAFDYDDLQQVYEWLKGDQPQDFRWIIWDSLTLFQDAVLIDDIMPDAVAENPRQEEFVPSKREYLINMNKIGRYVRQFAALPYNFGVSCHVMTTTESGGDGTLFMPQVQGKNMPSKVSGYMNVVGYLGKAAREVPGNDKKVVTQTMQFRREGRHYAKDRWDALGAYMDRPTLPKVEKAIEAKRAELLAAAASKGEKSAAPPTSIRRRTRRSTTT
jgi:hypothetical protein